MRSSASSLLALSAVAFAVAGCGESTTHSAAEVQQAFAAEGIELQSAFPQDLGSEVVPYLQRAFGYQLAHAMSTLASRHTRRWFAAAEDKENLVVVVTGDAFEAQHVLREPGLDALARFGLGYQREDNVLVAYDLADRDLVERALARLP